YEYLVMDPELYAITFYNQKKDKLKFEQLRISNLTAKSSVHLYKVHLDQHVMENQKYELSCKITHGNKIVPAHKYRTNDEDQLVMYNRLSNFFSSYFTQLSKIEYALKDDSLVEVTKDATHITNNTVTYVRDNTQKFH